MTRGTAQGNVVYSVHTARPGEIGSVEIVFTSEQEARAYARDRSRDWRITSAGVTRFTVGDWAPGARSAGTSTGRSRAST